MKTPSTLSFVLALFIYAILAVAGYWLWQQPITKTEEKVRQVPVTLSMFEAPKPVETIKAVEPEPVIEPPIEQKPKPKPEPLPEPTPVKPEPKEIAKPVVNPIKEKVLPPPKPVEKPKTKPVKPPQPKKVVDVKPKPPMEVVAPKEIVQPEIMAKVENPTPPQQPAYSAQQKADAEQVYLYELRQKIVRYAQDTYPKRAKRRRWQGEVMIGFTIMKNGKITNIKIIETSGRNILDRAALEIFQINMNSQFKPIPVETGRDSWNVTIPVTYNLKVH